MMNLRIFIGKSFTKEDLKREVGTMSLYPAVIERVWQLYQESRVAYGDFCLETTNE